MDNEQKPKFYAKPIRKIDNGGYWGYEEIGVFDHEDKQIGNYIRNYSSFYNTFFPFQKSGKWYALYSKDYTSTRVMELPSCKDLGGEKRDTYGFCPVDFYVPKYSEFGYFEEDEVPTYLADEKNDVFLKEEYLPYGFVAGCVWGDDSSWKIEYLDLSQADKGIIKREYRFGYIELSHDQDLKDAIRWAQPDRVFLTTETCYWLKDSDVFNEDLDIIQDKINHLHWLYKNSKDKKLKKHILVSYKKLKYAMKNVLEYLKNEEK